MEIKTTISINASTKKVWYTLSDFKSYPNWNPFIKSITGDVQKGNKIKVVLQGMTFKPKVLQYNERQEFRWLGALGIKGIFDGEHYFILEEQQDGTTRLTHGEKFAGVLVPLFKKKLNTETKAGFEAMNQALKNQCEQD